MKTPRGDYPRLAYPCRGTSALTDMPLLGPPSTVKRVPTHPYDAAPGLVPCSPSMSKSPVCFAEARDEVL